MPRRKTVLANEEIYHVFNKTIDGRFCFVERRDCKRAIESLWYYHLMKRPISYSVFLRQKIEQKTFYKQLSLKQLRQCQVIGYTLMSNHFHLILRQERNNGISKFLSDFQNSFTRYYNTKNNRQGALFLNQFKAVRIETTEQLIHVSRYKHLNPLTGYLIKDLDSLYSYEWSSLPTYLGLREELWLSSELVLEEFQSVAAYKQFLEDQVDYQRQLNRIEHLCLES